MFVGKASLVQLNPWIHHCIGAVVVVVLVLILFIL